MHVNIAGPDETQMAEAKRLAEDLLDAVSDEWEKARAVLEQQGYYVPPAKARGAATTVAGSAWSPGGVGAASSQAVATVGGYGQPAQAQPAAQTAPAAAAAAAAKSPEEIAMDKYWADYIKWEDSFKAYHGRLPSKEDGGQDVPPQYRK